jgi:peroxiredoxin
MPGRTNGDWIPWVMLAISGGMIIMLGMKHRALKNDFVEHRRAETRLQRGEYVPVFSGPSVTGQSVTVGEAASGNQVLILATSTCPFCRETLPYWRQMTARLSSSRGARATAVIALTTDSMHTAKVYSKTNQLPFPLVPFPSPRHASLYKGFVVPQTVVVDSVGRVVFARHGVIRTTQAIDSIIAAVNKAFTGPASEQRSVPGAQNARRSSR